MQTRHQDEIQQTTFSSLYQDVNDTSVQLADRQLGHKPTTNQQHLQPIFTEDIIDHNEPSFNERKRKLYCPQIKTKIQNFNYKTQPIPRQANLTTLPCSATILLDNPLTIEQIHKRFRPDIYDVERRVIEQENQAHCEQYSISFKQRLICIILCKETNGKQYVTLNAVNKSQLDGAKALLKSPPHVKTTYASLLEHFHKKRMWDIYSLLQENLNNYRAKFIDKPAFLKKLDSILALAKKKSLNKSLFSTRTDRLSSRKRNRTSFTGPSTKTHEKEHLYSQNPQPNPIDKTLSSLLKVRAPTPIDFEGDLVDIVDCKKTNSGNQYVVSLNLHIDESQLHQLGALFQEKLRQFKRRKISGSNTSNCKTPNPSVNSLLSSSSSITVESKSSNSKRSLPHPLMYL